MSCELTREQLMTGAPLDRPDHLRDCPTCRALAAQLDAGWSDLGRGLDHFARGGDFEAAFAVATAGRPANNTTHWDRRFHGLMIAAMVLFALFVAMRSRVQPEQAEAPPLDWSEVEQQVDEAAKTPWNALSEVDWRAKADELLEAAERLEAEGAVDDPELRALLFRAYTQTGRAAENANDPSQPYYRRVGGRSVNFYWYAAASLAALDPTLLELLASEGDAGASVRFYFGQFGEPPERPEPLQPLFPPR